VKHNPDAKIVLWAHNGHVSNTGFSGTRSMGSYLRQTYGKQMVNFGFAFNQGSFRAWEPGKSLHDFTVPPAPGGTLDRALAATGIPLFAVDLRSVPTARLRPGGLPRLINRAASAQGSAIRWNRRNGAQALPNPILTSCCLWKRLPPRGGIRDLDASASPILTAIQQQNPER
jgi:erythromycin esterase-like protein